MTAPGLYPEFDEVVLVIPEKLPPRMAARVSVDANGCWLWTGSKTSAGYGNLKVSGKNDYAHRMAYKALVGPIPDDLTIDHLCRVRACCNPTHLEAVPIAENIRRAGQAKEACRHGHPYDEANTYRSPRGERRCRACAKARYIPRRAA